MRIIKINNSRHGDKRELHELEEGVYSTEGFHNCDYLWVSQIEGKDNEFDSIDFDGGPFFKVGTPILNQTIKSINFKDGRYIIYTDRYVEKNNNEEPSV